MQPPDSFGLAFDHVAFAAPRIRDLLPLWQDVLGGEFSVGADSEVGWRTVRLTFAGAMVVELIEPLPGSTFLDGFLSRNPRGGVHHVTFKVSSLDEVLRRLDEQERPYFGLNRSVAQWQEVFVHPRDAHGVLLQIVESDEGQTPPQPTMTLDDVLAGRGYGGTGLVS